MIGQAINRFIERYRKRRAVIETRGIFPRGFKSDGYILIIVLIVTTLLVTVSTEFIIMTQTNIGYISKFNNRTKAVFLAKSGVELCRNILYADEVGASNASSRALSSAIDSYFDVWALDYPEFPVEDGNLKLQIVDENSKINASVLATEIVDQTPFYGITQRFFLNMGFSLDLTDAIIDWVDIDDSRYPYGAETPDYYSTLKPPYFAKNGSMDSIDEMRMIKGITPEIYYGLGGGNAGLESNLVDHNMGDISFDMKKFQKSQGDIPAPSASMASSSSTMKIGREKNRRLADYFTVYGNRQEFNNDINKININTASYRVLSALTEKMTDDRVTEIIRRRLSRPYSSVEEVKDFIDDDKLRSNCLSVKSYIFKIISTAKVGNSQVVITAFYNRQTREFLYWSEQ